MNDNELRAIIEQVLTEMNVSGTASASADGNAVKTAVVNAVKNAGCEQAGVEEGCLPDITQIDIKKQYLVEHPQNGEAYLDLKQYAPCRLVSAKQVPVIRLFRIWSSVQLILQHRMQFSMMLIRSLSIRWDSSPYRPSARAKMYI